MPEAEFEPVDSCTKRQIHLHPSFGKWQRDLIIESWSSIKKNNVLLLNMETMGRKKNVRQESVRYRHELFIKSANLHQIKF